MTTIRAAFAFAGMAILCACNSSDDSPTLVAATFRNPPEVRSANGELRIALNVATAPVQIAGQTVTTTVYNGMYIPPLLRLRPGDTLFLDIDNRSSEPTNLHLHVLNVSPRINSDGTVGDNVFVSIDPANRLSYRIAIPGTHNPGLYWYHTPRHRLAQRQVMGGLTGGLLIDGILAPLPQLQGLGERVLLLKDIHITPQGTVPDDISPSSPSIRMRSLSSRPIITRSSTRAAGDARRSRRGCARRCAAPAATSCRARTAWRKASTPRARKRW